MHRAYGENAFNFFVLLKKKKKKKKKKQRNAIDFTAYAGAISEFITPLLQ